MKYNGGREKKIPKGSLYFNPYGFQMYVPTGHEIFWELYIDRFAEEIKNISYSDRVYSARDLAFALNLSHKEMTSLLENNVIPKPEKIKERHGYSENVFSLIYDAWEHATQDKELFEKSRYQVNDDIRNYIKDNYESYLNHEFIM